MNQCAACHVLQFDPLISQPAPHDKPEIVKAFIIRKLTEYVAANPQVTRQPVNITAQEQQQLFEPSRNFLSSMRAAPERATTPAPSTPTQMATSANDWVTKRAADAERLLWSKNCSKCHAQTEEEGNLLPTSVKAVIPTRWFNRAEFDHQAHRMMTCISCHTKSQQSKLTSDVNLPGIELCRKCHESAGEVKTAADGRCYECHSYHDWRKEERIKGTFSLTTLLQKGH